MPGAKEPMADSQPDSCVLSQAQRPHDDLEIEKKVLVRPAPKESSSVATVVFWCGINAVMSACLIGFNKHLMHKDRFPYPVPLVAIHTTSSTLFVGLFWLLHRGCSSDPGSGFFSALPQALAESTIRSKVAVLACLFAVQLVLSNAAYLFSGVVFIQMMKEGNIPLVYLFSVIAALEVVHWQRIRVLIVIVFATLLTIKGELDFKWLGFMVQGTGQVFETVRIVLQAMMLNGKGLNLDVLTYMLLVMPACTGILISFLVLNSTLMEVTAVSLPSSATVLEWWPVLLLNAIVAVGLNFTTALVVKHASAVGLVLSGLLKDSAIIMVGAHVLKEPISSMQVLGFIVQLSGIFTYSMIKLYPGKFGDGVYFGFKRLITREADPLPAPNSFKDESHYGAARARKAYA
jgi:hypothetical protein